MKSPAAIFEAIGRAKAAASIVAEVPTGVRTDAAMGLVQITPDQSDRLARLCREADALNLRICTLLHEIADQQPTTGEPTHVEDDPAHRAQRS